jgi:hypothetical protein
MIGAESSNKDALISTFAVSWSLYFIDFEKFYPLFSGEARLESRGLKGTVQVRWG